MRYNVCMMKRTKKRQREKIGLVQLMGMFPSEEAAETWFEKTLWPHERCCGRCGSTRTIETTSRKPMPYWCSDCRKYFSIRTGTPIAKTNLPLRKWAVAIYLELTSLKSIASTKLASDIEVTQTTAWFMLHRIREAWAGSDGNPPFSGPVEVDETYIGGKRRNMRTEKRKALKGRGPVGKVAIAGIKDRASNQVQAAVVPNTKSETLCRFIMEHADGPETKIYTDDALTYHVLPNHETVKHSVGEYVRGKAHTNGVASFWSLLKRAHTGVFHKLSPKHLDRYVQEFAGKHNLREFDTLAQRKAVVRRLAGKSLTYRALTADNGLSSGAHS